MTASAGPSTPLRLAFVVPRYGEVVGGAELYAAWLARHLAAVGHQVEVFTTCALDHTTWKNVLRPGVQVHDGVKVRRFPTDKRDRRLHLELERAIAAGLVLTREEQLLWLSNGVRSTAMERKIRSRASGYDLVIAMPYLFGTTYFAVTSCPERAVVIPCLHDEPYAHLEVMREMLRTSMGVMFNSLPESRLGRDLAGALNRWAVVGIGFDRPGPGDGEKFLRRHKLSDRFLLYVGRRETGKNVPELVDHFIRYRERRGNDLQLVLAGSGELPVPPRKGVLSLDVDWRRERDAMYSASTVVCQPSRNESFSIVLMQAWLARRPVVVHGRGAVTRFHCERSNGGLWYYSYAEFEEILDRLLGDESLRAALGDSGRRFVEREYSWDAVLGRFITAANSWLGRDSVLE